MNYFDLQGIIAISPEHGPFTQKEWEYLTALLDEDKKPYESVKRGGQGEEVLVKAYRIKQSGPQSPYFCPELEKICTSDTLLNFFKKITGMEEPYIDRAQAHSYHKGGFVGLHTDVLEGPGYTHSVIITINDNYEGGEFVTHHPNAGVISYKPKKFSTVIAHSHLPHEVYPVTKGHRKSLCFFMLERKNYDKAVQRFGQWGPTDAAY